MKPLASGTTIVLVIAVLTLEGQGQQGQRRVRVRGRPRRIQQPTSQPQVEAAAAATGGSSSPCPELEGLQLYPDLTSCHAFYKCANGTLTHEKCENGLLFDSPEKGAPGGVHNHCSYNWAVDCGERPVDEIPIPGARDAAACEYQFGIYPSAAAAGSDHCQAEYTKCAFGSAVSAKCDLGLVYDHRIHGCNWPDQLVGYLDCDPARLLGFQCPGPDQLTALESRFAPFPRFAIEGLDSQYILCVNGSPRLSACGAGSLFSPSTLTCIEQF